MADDDNDWPSTVGYRHPPMHSRFQKGQSGNPKGRPKASLPSLSEQPILGAFLAEAAKLIPVREGEKVGQISTRDALVKAVLHKGLKGDVRAQALAIATLQTADEAKAREIAHSNEILEAYQSRARAALEEAARRGLPPPKFLPHPDDIILSPRAEPRFLGPLDEEEEAKLEHSLSLREVLMMQDALDQRSSVRLSGQPLKEPGAARLLAMLVDRLAPPRLRFSDFDFIKLMMKYDRLSKRQLLKSLYQAWRDIGIQVPRGFIFPNQSEIVRYFSMFCALLAAVRAGSIDLDRMVAGEWNEVARNIAEKYGYQLPPNYSAEFFSSTN